MSVGWLGCTVEIYLHFTKEKHARWAYHVAEDMIKLLYAPTELPWVQEASNRASLSERYLNYQQYIKELDLHQQVMFLFSVGHNPARFQQFYAHRIESD